MRLSQEDPLLRTSVLGIDSWSALTNTPRYDPENSGSHAYCKGGTPPSLIITIIVALDQTALSELKA